MAENNKNYRGKQVGSYRLIDQLGSGGFADVYLGEHIYLKTQSAIKMLHVQLSERALQAFLNEAQTIARLEHSNIVRVFDYGVQDGSPFLVMSYAPNGTLRQHYPRGTRLPLQYIVPYIQQVASALNYAHQMELIHRDVKPENMLVGQQRQILLSDFGLALAVSDSSAQEERGITGTISYMAPEQVRGKGCYASDQYSLSIVAYEWICGEKPFTGSLMEIGSQHVLTPPPSLQDRVPNLPSEVEQVVFKALAKEPTERFASVLDFAQALQQASEVTTRTKRFTRKRRTASSDRGILFQYNPHTTSRLNQQANVPKARAGLDTVDRPAKNGASSNLYALQLPVDSAMTVASDTPSLHTSGLSANPGTTPGMSLPPSKQSKRKLRFPIIIALIIALLIGSASLGGVWYNHTDTKGPLQQQSTSPDKNRQPVSHNTLQSSTTTTTPDATSTPIVRIHNTSSTPTTTKGSTPTPQLVSPTSGPTPQTTATPIQPMQDCIQGSTTNITFTSTHKAGDPAPFLFYLTNCSGNGSKNWQGTVTSSGWLSLNLSSGSIDPQASVGLQVQASSSGLKFDTYQGSITFTAGTASWTVNVTYTVTPH